jgi:hypothetical protein
MNRYTVELTPAGSKSTHTVATTASYPLAVKKAQEWRRDNPAATVEVVFHPSHDISPWKVWELEV